MVDGVSGPAESQSERATAKQIGVSRKTVSKRLRHSVPPGYPRKAPPVSPELGPFAGMVNQIKFCWTVTFSRSRATPPFGSSSVRVMNTATRAATPWYVNLSQRND